MDNTLPKKDTQTKRKSKKRRSAWLLILLIVFAILFLLTTGILGSQLYQLAARDQHTVDLGLGESGQTIELFRISYSNEHDQITVQSVNADNVIAPGTTVNYDIRLRNNDTTIIDFLMVPNVDFWSDDVIPVEFKIMDDYGNYILGSDTHWASSDDMNALRHKGSIHPGEIFTYHLSWCWVYEVSDEQNAFDTYLGNQQGDDLPGIVVGITTEAVASPYPAVKDTTHITHLCGESFGCCWCCYLVWLLLLVCLLLTVWILQLRKKLNKQDETLEKYKELLQHHGIPMN